MNQLKSKLVSFLFICVVIFAVAPAMAQNGDPFALPPPPAAGNRTPSPQLAQPGFVQAVPLSSSNPSGGKALAPKPKTKEPTPIPSTDCIFGQAEVAEGEDPRCLTAKEWKEAEVKEATEKGKIEGASSARFWGWTISVLLCLAFTGFSLWMWFVVIPRRLDKLAGVMKRYINRIKALERRVEGLDGVEITVEEDTLS